MNRWLTRIGVTGSLVLLIAYPSWGQSQQGSGSSGSGSQPSSGSSTRGNTSQPNNRSQQRRDTQSPLFVEGQVIDEGGRAPGELISVKLTCGNRTIQSIKTDVQGYFRFALGFGTQANADYSAADEAPPPSVLTGVPDPSEFGGIGGANGIGGFGPSNANLTGCEVRIAVPGYSPVDAPITDPAALGTIDIGVLQLRRIGKPSAGSVSASSLLVPNNARKEFDQGVKDMNSNRLPQATQHLEKAVKAYDKYAAAWTELGRAYAAGQEKEKARQSYQKAIAVDPKYTPPYISLGVLQLDDRDYQGAVDNLGKAVEADPAITAGLGGYILGVANYQLDHLDAAQQNLLQAETVPHSNFPQLHVMLADIFFRKQDSPTAATHMRAYLKEAPNGPFAAQVRQKLDETDKEASNSVGRSGAVSTVAP